MANLLRSHGGKTVAVIEGVCASAATFLAAACDRVEAYEASLIMVHGPWGGAQGNAAKLRESADLLDKLAEGMASLYRRRGISEDTIAKSVSYTHLTLPTTLHECRSRWSPYH